MLRIAFPLFALLVASLLCACGRAPRGTGAYFFLDHLDEAEASYDRNQFASFRKGGRLTDSVTLKQDTRRALVPPLRSRFRFEVELQDAPSLQFAVGAAALGSETALPFFVEFEIRVDSGDGEEVVYAHRVRRSRGNQWRDEQIDMSRWAGRRINLTFVTRADVEESGRVLAFWGHPVLYQGRRNPERPNLILISIDCLRADHVGAYGYTRDTTPNIDDFARDGVVYEQATSTSSWTLPTHMSMLTGLAPSLHGVVSHEHKLARSTPYLPELLASSGYETRGLVTWVFVAQLFGFERGFDTFRLRAQASAERIVDDALEAVSSASTQNQFLFMHFLDPHWPYVPPPDFRERFGDRPGDISTLMDLVVEGQAPSEPRQVNELIQLYDGEIAYVDRELGRFFDGLKEMGLYDESLIVVTADHGEAFYEHGRWQHGNSLYEEVLRVPLIVKWPGQGATGRVTTPVSSTSLFRTFLEAAKLQQEARGTVAGLGDYAPGQDTIETPPPIASELSWAPLGRRGIWPPPGITMMRSFRDDKWKYIATIGEPGADLANEELYDLREDPHEARDVSVESSREIARFRQLLRAHTKVAESLGREGTGVELDFETRQLLESLGYVNH